jgi:hypothetical protein
MDLANYKWRTIVYYFQRYITLLYTKYPTGSLFSYLEDYVPYQIAESYCISCQVLSMKINYFTGKPQHLYLHWIKHKWNSLFYEVGDRPYRCVYNPSNIKTDFEPLPCPSPNPNIKNMDFAFGDGYIGQVKLIR